MAQQIKKKYLENGSVDGDKLKLLEGQSVKIVHGGQEVDLIKPVDGKVQVLGSEVELKSSSESKLAEAKSYTDSEIQKLTNLAPGALDTFKEIADQLAADESAVAAVVSNVSALSSALTQAQSDFTAAINSEASARQTADANLQTQINNAIGNASSDFSAAIAQEVSDRQSADSVLDGKIETEKNRAIAAETSISNSLSTLDSYVGDLNNARIADKAELDGKITTEKNRAEGVEATLSSAISSETSARIASDNSILSSLSTAQANFNSAIETVGSNLTQEIADRQTADAAKLVEAKAYTDQEIQKLTNLAPSTLDTFKEVADKLSQSESDVSGIVVSLSNEVSRAQGEEARIEGKVDGEISARQAAISSVESALTSAQSSFTSAINNEVSARQSADSALSSDIAAKLVEAKSYADTKKSEAQSYADAAVLVEKNRAEAAEAAKLVEAKAYTDSSIAATQSTVTSAITDEITARTSADNALDSRITVLEGAKKPTPDKESFTFGSNGVGLSYVELSKQVLEKSIQINVNRLGMNYGEDYSVSVVNGKTRITWIGSVASGGVEAHENGDKCFVTYFYEA